MKKIFLFLSLALSLSANAQISKAKMFFFLTQQASTPAEDVPEISEVTMGAASGNYNVSWVAETIEVK